MKNKKSIVVFVILCLVIGTLFAGGQKEAGAIGKAGRPVIRVNAVLPECSSAGDHG